MISVSTKESVRLVIDLLDEESDHGLSDADKAELVGDAGKSRVVWSGQPNLSAPIAMLCFERDSMCRGSFGWMMTTDMLHMYKAHRQLLRAMRNELAKEVAEREYVWGECGRNASIARMLQPLGAEFRQAPGDHSKMYWIIRMNPKLEKVR